jgi:DNA repair photolyase
MELISAKTIVSKTKNSAWFGTDYNMNIYKGCSHGCIYCDSRSECYHIDDFDTVRAKENALEIINRDLKSKTKLGVIGTGAMSDPYNPFEKEYELTRNALKLVANYNFGIAIATKSDLVTRDIDILKEIKKNAPVIIKITITAANDNLSKTVEPNAPVSSKRFSAIKELTENNIFAGILLMPVLPYIEDNEENIKEIILLAKESGAKFIYPAFGVTLRQNQREWYFKKLDKHFPTLKEKYSKQFGNSYSCVSPNAKALWNLFKSECERFGILYKMQDIVSAYKAGY